MAENQRWKRRRRGRGRKVKKEKRKSEVEKKRRRKGKKKEKTKIGRRKEEGKGNFVISANDDESKRAKFFQFQKMGQKTILGFGIRAFIKSS